jgi:hypothetical protein
VGGLQVTIIGCQVEDFGSNWTGNAFPSGIELDAVSGGLGSVIANNLVECLEPNTSVSSYQYVTVNGQASNDPMVSITGNIIQYKGSGATTLGQGLTLYSGGTGMTVVEAGNIIQGMHSLRGFTGTGLVILPAAPIRGPAYAANTVTSSATPAIDTDGCDLFSVTALATAITSMTTNLTGSPVDGQNLRIRLTDNGTARAITWGSSFMNSGNATLPTTTIVGKSILVGLTFDAVKAKWVCMAADSGY